MLLDLILRILVCQMSLGEFKANPRCSIVLVIGGTFPESESCDSPAGWGTHNMDLGKQSSSVWHEYELNITTYVVPPEIIAKIGGS